MAAGLVLALGCAHASPPNDPTLEHIADTTFAKHQARLAGLAVQVTQHGRLRLAKAYGFADIASKRALSLTDVFRVASISRAGPKR